MNKLNNYNFKNLTFDTCKISIITVSYNCEDTIEDTILSVASQDFPRIEHIIIDGNSTDSTLSIIEKHKSKLAYYVSEPDQGIYDAMNKGLLQTKGDIVGILNADDIYYDKNCIATVIDEFYDKKVEAVCGDLVYVAPDNMDKIVRHYRSKGFTTDRFAFGIMPPHPAFFVARHCYEKYGLFKIDYMIAADFELLARFLSTHHVKYSCLPETLVKMRTGGVSTKNLKSNLILNKEILRACKENNIQTNFMKVYSKYFYKFMQLINV